MLILRFLSGLTTAEVATGFLIETATMQQRILKTGIPFGRPAPAEVGGRLSGVLRVPYLIFTQGVNATTGPERPISIRRRPSPSTPRSPSGRTHPRGQR